MTRTQLNMTRTQLNPDGETKKEKGPTTGKAYYDQRMIELEVLENVKEALIKEMEKNNAKT